MNEEQIFEQLKQIEENRACFECGSLPTAWASVSFGIFLCIKCAGKISLKLKLTLHQGLHRSIGVNVSFIRSLTLDTWKPRHLETMKLGGNKRARDYFTQNNAKPEYTIYDTTIMQKQVDQFYTSKIALEYKDILKHEVDAIHGYFFIFSSLIISTEPVPDYSHQLPSQVPKKFANATAISSDEFFGNEKKVETSKSCCCAIL